MTAAHVTAHGSAARPPRPRVAAQFDGLPQQRAASTLGMWIFLTTETLFFGALFFGYSIARAGFPEAFAAASRHTNLVLGTANTAILLTSSFFMALAVRAAALRARRATTIFLLATALLGLAFAGIKLTEYALDYREQLVPVLNFAFAPEFARGAEIFFWLYFTATGLHLVHLAIGVVIVLVFAWRSHHERVTNLDIKVEMAGLYWHFVDLVWIFLYPLLYLVSRA
jgi:cytochrome c oxidase subunit 3